MTAQVILVPVHDPMLIDRHGHRLAAWEPDEHKPGGNVEKLTINGYQSEVDTWVKTHGVRYFNEMTNLAILVEEVGEVARLMARTYGEQSFKADAPPQHLADELADVMFFLTCLANQTGIDMTRALELNLDKKTRRDSERHKNNPKLKL